MPAVSAHSFVWLLKSPLASKAQGVYCVQRRGEILFTHTDRGQGVVLLASGDALMGAMAM